MNSRRFSGLLCYCVLGIVGISLLVRYLLVSVFGVSSPIFGWFDKVAYWLTALATLVSAFSYAQARRNGIYMILLLVFIALIVVFTFVL